MECNNDEIVQIDSWWIRIKPVSGSVYLEEAERKNDEILEIDSEKRSVTMIKLGKLILNGFARRKDI